MYLGINDKDTNEPVFSPEEAKQILKEILIRYFGGYTIQEAEGGWIGDDGTLYMVSNHASYKIFFVQHDDQWNEYYNEIEYAITDLLAGYGNTGNS